MRVVLVSPYPDITAYGVRGISSYLRANGMATRLVFLPDPPGDRAGRYPSPVMEELVSLCADADLVGVSVMSNYVENARQVTGAVKERLGVPVLWGGVHPTIRPEACLETADLVCVGDGEEAVRDVCRAVVAGEPVTGIPNIWSRRPDGALARNPVRPLVRDLDTLPPPDWSHEDHHIWDGGNGISPLTPERTREFLAQGSVSRLLGLVGYQTLTDRGCPHRCAYCVNDALKSLYQGNGYLRWRSVGHVMAELEEAVRRMPYIGYIWISDDAFFARPLETIREFCRQYKERIGLPFTCLGSPATITAEKVNALVDAGMIYLQMGVQSGSARIQSLFGRQSMGNDKILAAMQVINNRKDMLLPPTYDLILDAPTETDADRLDTLRLVSRIPKPFRLQLFSLVLYPGTKLAALAAADGLPPDEPRPETARGYVIRRPDFLSFLLLCAKDGRFPSGLLRFLTSERMAATLGSRVLAPVWRLAFVLSGPARRFGKRLLGR